MIELQGVSKRFRLYPRPMHRIADWMGFQAPWRDFWALRDVDLSIPPGRTLGLVGPNGAGKSTLLKLITGTLLPTEGRIAVDGRVAALLELGTGFHPEFTGRQNIRVNGQMLGLSPEELGEAEQEIIAFSELGPFIDHPLRTYSSGMVVRLGFAVAAAVRPQVLIVDEALSVGDARFAQKCIRRIGEFRAAGATILFVSHDASVVLALCDEAVLMDQGRVVNRGLPQDVMDHYNALQARRGEGNVQMTVAWDGSAEAGPRRSGTFQALVARLELLDAQGAPAEVFPVGGEMRLRMEVVFLSAVADPTVGFLIKDRLGIDVFGTNTARQGVALGRFEAGEALTLTVRLPLDLGDGAYSLTVAVHGEETHLGACYDWSDRAAAFRVVPQAKQGWHGLARLRPELAVERKTASKADLEHVLEQVFSRLGDPVGPEEGSPSPFLEGFGEVETDEQGRSFRAVSPGARLVVRPQHGRLRFLMGRDVEALKVRRLGQSEAALFPVGAAEGGRKSTTVPVEPGRAAILEVTPVPEGTMRFYEARSVKEVVE